MTSKVFTSIPGIEYHEAEGTEPDKGKYDNVDATASHHLRPWLSGRNTRRGRRQSRPGLILDSIHGRARKLYPHASTAKVDLSYTSPQRRGIRGRSRHSQLRRLSNEALAKEAVAQDKIPLSLHTILARYVHATSMSLWDESEFKLADEELDLLESKGYTAKSVENWASTLTNMSSILAAENFLPGKEIPPLFVVLLFLRRRHVKQLALGIIMRHIDLRLQYEEPEWSTLKLLVLRLLRHARMVWPESLPWVASVFTTEAKKIWDKVQNEGNIPSAKLSNLTHFCNALLAQLSIPASIYPILASLHQQNAQFQILRFMADRSPALIMTRTGFRATARTQLAHAKTLQEQEWAELKGASWPPWKQDRNAMDEVKGYKFGASRASRILHRMYEAGYAGHQWENLAELYAGWDTDLSPTIQTRTTLPNLSIGQRNNKRIEGLLWAGRVRSTRTRREAWACFLAYEASNVPPNQEVYHAMFEKLHYPEVELRRRDSQSTLQEHTRIESTLLPGDTKEVWPEPKSPINVTYVAEPIPSYEQLYHRMTEKGIQPKSRLLAFMIETSRDFLMTMDIMESAQDDFGGGLRRLLNASIFHQPSPSLLPDYVLAAFIRFLCHFGRFTSPPRVEPIAPSPEYHEDRFKFDKHYLLEYAYSLLALLRPHYRPAWTAYMRKVLFTPFRNRMTTPIVRYKIICQLLDWMQQEDIDIDAEQFRLVCTAVAYAAQSAFRRSLSTQDARRVLTNGPRQIRTLFHNLISANVDPIQHSLTAPPANNANPIPPHIPSPAILHAYVRALGILGDFEGLYSFSTWAASNHTDVTARANAQHGGPRQLRRTLIAMRAAIDGVLEHGRASAPRELAELVKAQVESVDEWDGWPSDDEVELYTKNTLRYYTV